MFTLGRLAPISAAISPCDISSVSSTSPAHRLGGVRQPQQQPGQPDLDPLQRERFQLFGRLAQAFAEKANDAGCHRRTSREQVLQRTAAEAKQDTVAQRSEVGAAAAAVEDAEFTDHFAGPDDTERKLPSIRGADRNAQLTGDDQIDVIGRIAALEHHGASLELAPVQQRSHRGVIGRGQIAEQREGRASSGEAELDMATIVPQPRARS